MKKKFLFILIVLIAAIVGAIYIPWDNLLVIPDRLLGVGDNVSSLKVYSLGGDMKIFIDDEEKGLVSETDNYKEILPISEGLHEVRLTRIASRDGFYKDFVKEIDFVGSFDTVISWEAGPSEKSSSGWILYAAEGNNQNNNSKLNFSCIPENCSLVFNQDKVEVAPFQDYSINLDKKYSLKAREDGYLDLEFELLPEEQEARDKLENYELFLEVNLYKIPLVESS